MSDTPRARRWLKIALFASLALNLAVVGLFAGAILRDGPPHRGDRSARHEGFLYFRAFTEDQQRELRRAFRGATVGEVRPREDRKAFRARFLEGYERAATALRQQPFDREALAQVLEAQSERARQGRARGEQVLLDYLAGLSPEDRAAYADRLLREIKDVSRR